MDSELRPSPEGLEVRREGALGHIRLRRPHKLNALTDAMILGLTEAFQMLGADEGVRVILLSAEGDHFCAGRDVSAFAGMQEGADPLDLTDEFARVRALIEAMTTSPLPIVAAIQGYALGAGTGLATWSDIALAAPNAQFGYSEINLGIAPSLVAVEAVRALVPRKAVAELLLTGRRIDAAEAARLGIITRVVEGDVLAAARAVADELAAKSRSALRLTKQLLDYLPDLDRAAALEYTTQVAALSTQTRDAREGVAAFLAKRRPRW